MTQADEAFALRERRTPQDKFEDLLRCARTCRSIASRYAADARDYEASGNRRLYIECNLEARNYRRRARDYLDHARRYRPFKARADNSNMRKLQ